MPQGQNIMMKILWVAVQKIGTFASLERGILTLAQHKNVINLFGHAELRTIFRYGLAQRVAWVYNGVSLKMMKYYVATHHKDIAMHAGQRRL